MVVYVLLGIIAAIILLFCVKITVEFRYEESAELLVRVLFIKLRLIPPSDKPKKEKKKKPEKPPEEETKKEEPKEEKPKGESFIQRFLREQGFSGVMQFLGDLLRALNTMLGDICKRSFVVQKFFLRIRVGKSDAASTAIAYGKTCAAVYPALGYICSQMCVRQYDADVAADYLSGESTAQMVFTVSLRPIKLTNALVRFAFRALIAFIKAKKRASVRKKQSVAIERNVSHE